MLPDRVSNPGPLTYESGALLIALHSLTLNGKDLLLEEQILSFKSRPFFTS